MLASIDMVMCLERLLVFPISFVITYERLELPLDPIFYTVVWEIKEDDHHDKY